MGIVKQFLNKNRNRGTTRGAFGGPQIRAVRKMMSDQSIEQHNVALKELQEKRAK